MMSKKVLQIAFILLLLGMTIQWAGKAQSAEMGPLHAQNRYPLYLMFLQPEPDSPRVIEKGRIVASLATDYTSIYIDEENSEWSALMDMEMAVVELTLSYGLTRYINISLGMPWISMYDGFLDSSLESYHGVFGFPNYGKENGPVDEFGYSVLVDDVAWFDSRSGGLHPGDSVASVKIQFIHGGRYHGLTSSLLAALKLPTGDAAHGFGSGEFDQGVFLLNQYGLPPVTFYLNTGIAFLADPKTQGADIHVNDTITLLAGVEYMASDTWSLMGQFNFVTSPFYSTGISQMDQDSLELSLGGAVLMQENLVLEFAFSEDLTRTAPDFTVHGALRYTFGSGLTM